MHPQNASARGGLGPRGKSICRGFGRDFGDISADAKQGVRKEETLLLYLRISELDKEVAASEERRQIESTVMAYAARELRAESAALQAELMSQAEAHAGEVEGRVGHLETTAEELRSVPVVSMDLLEGAAREVRCEMIIR